MTATAIQNQLDIAFRLRRAVCNISEKSPSHARAVIDQFLQHIAPSRAPDYGAEFPVTCRRHRFSGEHMSASGFVQTGRWPLLYFHIGNAVLGFYDSVRKVECPRLEDRVALLESVARNGLDSFHVSGDDATGYFLEINELPPAKPAEDVSHDAGGRTGIPVPGSKLLLRP